ncbi:U3 small nucleolar RNA-associated protein MPP10 [Geosmithia morbida]|uniref:U3 small nucleolar ribonucleoprotein protein MPP10 n=1 Tax=Geosmithia morbida TaxID=1094350 RepID=A0A9P5D408_9HYPO|nr:U3 small nucleolar RNA-associated protein MPP10 [Geosmithia morbida]KAF4121024.1 U3 small nucleolar RNA-associated protein MPP10 [Geosmithia morbida]
MSAVSSSSTSHTLTEAPSATTAAGNPSATMATTALFEFLQPGKRHAFIQPTPDIPTGSLNFVKGTLEEFAGQVADEQQERRKLRDNKKRKRGDASDKDSVEVLKVRKVYVDGFETNQVWQQAKRIIGGVLRHADLVLGEMQDQEEIVTNSISSGGGGTEAESEEEEEDEQLGEDESLMDDEALGGELGGEEEEWEDAEEGLKEDDDDLEQEEGDDDEEEDEDEDDDAAELVEDADGLNDGFFSLAEFNKQSQWFESQDAKGDPNTDQASDDEEIDWAADPLAPGKASTRTLKGKKSKDEELLPAEEENDDEEDDGPTFGNMDLYAPEGDSDDEGTKFELEGAAENDDAMGGLGNANDIYYNDFFEPPSRKKTNSRGGKKSAAFAKKEGDDDESAEVERAMADVRRDLFDDESEVEDSDDALSDVSAGDPKSRRSAHERRQAKLAEEIRKLEAASVAKREWAMSGEAAAADRPVNSLLEEDVDFEHVGKPVPVITPEVSGDIEDMIKRRILAQEFDEVLRRRPGMDSLPSGTRRGLQEDVDDTKAKKGLAEVYEEEHAKNANPDTYVSQSEERLQREEREIETMWRSVSASLDALSSWHYRPRPVEPSLTVVSDVATVTMEDAQPATAQGVAGEDSRMAPQEVYKASAKTAEKGEVVASSGLPVAKAEMSREDKQRRRRREKERIRKAGGVTQGKILSTRAKMERDTVADLKKGGVKVINRKGEVTDVQGNKVKAAKTVSSGSYKL